MTENLISMAENFEGSCQGERRLFAGWDGIQIRCIASSEAPNTASIPNRKFLFIERGMLCDI